jgi:hypothetical protein
VVEPEQPADASEPGILGMYRQLMEKKTAGSCPTMVRVDNAGRRCSLEWGHAGEHLPSEVAV